jgi:protocatechuate 3,4-dioxygenase alpha subunit
MPEPTPPQTVGPFFSIGLDWADGPLVAEPGSNGAIAIRGAVLDGEGAPVPDALVETWQTDPAPPARGLGRCPTDARGRWEIVTCKPAAAGDEAPHLAVAIFARGLLHRVATRIYFGDEPDANAGDPLLASLGDPERASLLATPDGAGAYRFDIHLQGDHETAFFAL